jgi:hypothetical protein
MDKYLFPNFLSNPAEYAQAEALWIERWKERRECVGDRDDWTTPWLSTEFADGTPCRDGNPIFSAFSPLRRRGIRVIQLEPSADPRDRDVWIDAFDKDGLEKIDELVISCVLTRETLFDAMDMMSQWMDKGKIDFRVIPISSWRGPRRLPQLVAG